MGLLDSLERGIEKAVRSAFSAGGSRAVQPVEIAHALRQAMDAESFPLSEGHTVAPNDFAVRFSAPDFERARAWGSPLATELCDEAIRHARTQGYTLHGSVRVAFHLDESLRPGHVQVDTRLDDGASPAAPTPASTKTPAPAPRVTSAPPAPSAPPRRAAGPRPVPRPEPRFDAHGAHSPAADRSAAPARATGDQATVVLPRGGSEAGPSIEVAGVRHPVPPGDVILGRSAERADIVVPDSSVSREHVRLVRVGRSVTLIDLGSRNGVVVNGVRVDGSVTLHEGDRITVGQTDLVFHTGGGRDSA